MDPSVSGICKIKDGVEVVSEGAFDECDSLSGIEFPSSVTKIGASNSRYQYVEEIYITDLSAWCGIDFSYSRMFYDSDYSASLYINGELASDIVIPNGVSSINDYAFCRFSNLTSVAIPDLSLIHI